MIQIIKGDIVTVAGIKGRWLVEKIEPNGVDDRATLDVNVKPAPGEASILGLTQGYWFALEGCALAERGGFKLPTVEELTSELVKFQMCVQSAAFVWLVTHPIEGWRIEADRKKLEGVYARTTIGKADTEQGLRMAAETLIERVANWIAARDENDEAW